jgi:hypothetical protein
MVAALAGCSGARTGLTVAADDARPAANVEQPGPILGTCPAALLAGSPAPIANYCPTHAGQSALAAPKISQRVWAIDLPGTLDTDATIVVAPSGRSFLPVDTNDVDSGWIPTQLLAIDAGGAIAATRDFGGGISSPWLAADGSIVLTARRPTGLLRSVVWLDASLATVRDVPIEQRIYGAPAIGPDGALWFVVDDFKAPVRVLSLTKSGAMQWLSPELGRYARPIATSRTGGPVVALYGAETLDDFGGPVSVVALGPGGAVAWSTVIEEHGHVVGGPAVGPDGAIHCVLWTHQSTQTTLVVLEPNGALRFTADVTEKPWGGGTGDLAVGPDGSVYVKAGEALTALDAAGHIRWKRPAHPNVPTGLTIAADGTVLLAQGGFVALDPLSGAEQWHYDHPVEPMGKVIYFPGIGTLADGRVVYGDAGKRLFAAGP